MLKAVIIDDEHKAVKSIQLIVKEYCHNVTIVGEAYSTVEGMQVIKETKPDLVFLDVEMPQGSGFEMLEKMTERDFDVIFVTAYNHYAIKAIKFSAVDYILKPIDIYELISAVNRIDDKKKSGNTTKPDYNVLLENVKTGNPAKLAIPITEGIEFVEPKNILYINADRSYSEIYFTDRKKMLVSKSLMEIEELLSSPGFFRIHKSHLINLEHVKKFIRTDGGYVEMSNGDKIMISRRKKDEFIEVMSRYTK